MTFYLIGLGLDKNSISTKAVEALKKCSVVYLENYTVDFPYHKKELEKSLGKSVMPLSREEVESEDFLRDAKKKNIALLVYGNPLSATTHISLILNCKKNKISYEIIHAESVLIAIAESGLQLYKFGKTASMPKWQKNYEPDSFYDIILQNQKIKAHTLLLTDIGLSVKEALEQLEQVSKKRNVSVEKIVICSHVGTNQSKIYFDFVKKLKNKKIKLPFCIIIPSELHFIEEEALGVLGV